MARVVAISVAVFLFLFTFSHARDIHEPETTRSENPKPQQHDTVSSTLDSIDPVPLTLLNFCPINRHIHPRHQLPLPLSLRRCHHGHHRREIPYGNDAIVLSDASGGDRSGRVRRIPTRWTKFQRVEPRFPEMMAHQDDDHHHHHHHHHHHGEKGWFAKRIGEFMNLF